MAGYHLNLATFKMIHKSKSSIFLIRNLSNWWSIHFVECKYWAHLSM